MSDSGNDKRFSPMMRVGSFSVGCVFMVLAGVDAIFDPFPGPETFFATTGIALITIGVAGQPPKNGGGKS
jgi:hypothetical protein